MSENTISIGRDLSNILGLDIGDEVSITSPSGVQTLIGSLPKQKSFPMLVKTRQRRPKSAINIQKIKKKKTTVKLKIT